MALNLKDQSTEFLIAAQVSLQAVAVHGIDNGTIPPVERQEGLITLEEINEELNRRGVA